jgi:hypothetical protein
MREARLHGCGRLALNILRRIKIRLANGEAYHVMALRSEIT